MNPKLHKAKAAAIIASIIPSVLLTVNSNIGEHYLLCLATLCSIWAVSVMATILEILTANTLQETQKPKTPYSQFLLHHFNYIRYKAFTSKNTIECIFYRQLGDMLF